MLLLRGRLARIPFLHLGSLLSTVGELCFPPSDHLEHSNSHGFREDGEEQRIHGTPNQNLPTSERYCVCRNLDDGVDGIVAVEN